MSVMLCLVCYRTVMTPYSVRRNKGKKEKKPVTSQKVDIRFPPGRPTAAVIESLCRNQKIRPLYSNKCLPNIGYEWLARQAKTINRMEKGFKQCCKKRQDVLVCAEQKVQRETYKPTKCFVIFGKVIWPFSLIPSDVVAPFVS